MMTLLTDLDLIEDVKKQIWASSPQESSWNSFMILHGSVFIVCLWSNADTAKLGKSEFWKLEMRLSVYYTSTWSHHDYIIIELLNLPNLSVLNAYMGFKSTRWCHRKATITWWREWRPHIDFIVWKPDVWLQDLKKSLRCHRHIINTYDHGTTRLYEYLKVKNNI